MRTETFTNPKTGTTYKRISKNIAKQYFINGKGIIIAPCKVNMNNPYHHFWAYIEHRSIDNIEPQQDFDRIVNSYIYYNCCNELGLYPKFFVPSKVQL